MRRSLSGSKSAASRSWARTTSGPRRCKMEKRKIGSIALVLEMTYDVRMFVSLRCS